MVIQLCIGTLSVRVVGGISGSSRYWVGWESEGELAIVVAKEPRELRARLQPRCIGSYRSFRRALESWTYLLYRDLNPLKGRRCP